jgi:DNA polymerase III epsilon subunit-like protein
VKQAAGRGAQTLLFCFDLETTGLEYGIVPVEIAAIVIDPDRWRELGRFHSFLTIPKDALLEPVALKIHQAAGRNWDYFNEFGVAPREAYLRLKDWLKDYGDDFLPAGHNISAFDCPLMQRELKRYDVELPVNWKYSLDLAPLSLATFVLLDKRLQRNNLTGIAKLLGVEHKAAHTAMSDVETTAACLEKMMTGRLKQYRWPSVESQLAPLPAVANPPPRDALQAHREMRIVAV